MKFNKPARLPLAIALAATTAVGFGGGALWNAAAGHVAAAEDPANPQATHGHLGMRLAPLTADVAARLGIQQQDGLVVLAVTPDGPAAQAGVQRLDVVKSINGTAVTAQTDLRSLLQNIKPGDQVQLSLSRDGSTQNLTVTAAAMPVGAGRPGHKGGAGGFGFGMPVLPELQDIPAAERFDHLMGGTFTVTDKDGKAITLRIVPGKVTSASDTQVSVTPNGQSSATTYTITSTTRIPGKGSDLQAGDKVVVTVKDGSNEALAVHPAEPKLRQGMPPAGGQPGVGPGRRGGPRMGPGAGQPPATQSRFMPGMVDRAA